MAFSHEGVEARIESEWVGTNVNACDEDRITLESKHVNDEMLDQIEDMGWSVVQIEPLSESLFEMLLVSF